MNKEFLIIPFKVAPIGHPFRYQKDWWIKTFGYNNTAQNLGNNTSIFINPENLIAIESNIITKFLWRYEQERNL